MAERRRDSRPASSVPSLVKDLVDQFDRPLDFYRELIQNSIDAGANLVTVSLQYDGTNALIRVEDDGEGMDERIIDDFLLVLFRSSKEEDFTKIGKFGIGFVSVFAPRPQMVRVLTSKGGESWRIDFPSYKRYEKYKLFETREGTLVELTKKMSKPEFDQLTVDSLATIRHWCKHSDARIAYEVVGSGKGPEMVTEPFGIKDASHRHSEEGTQIELAFTAEEKPFYGFYNRGLTLKEGAETFFPGVAFKAQSRYLEHTLTRDNVMIDQNYHKLMAILKKLVESTLPERAHAELRELSERIIKRSAQAEASQNGADPELAKLCEAWRQRVPYLQWLFSGYLARWWKYAHWALFPALGGKPMTLSAVKESIRLGGNRIYHDSAPNRITKALSADGVRVLPSGPWVDCLSAWTGVEAVRASQVLIQPQVIADPKLPAPMQRFLQTLRWLDAQSGSKYSGIVAADFGYPGSPLKDKMFVTQKEPGALSPAEERPLSSLLWFRRRRRWALLHHAHPATEKFSRLNANRPGLAAFLCLKMMHLHDGEVPPDRESEYTNLAEKTEAKLLSGALRLDTGKARF